jgi:L-asparagine oxygenase
MTRPDVPCITLSAEQSNRWKAQIRKFDYPCGDNDAYALSPQEAMAPVETAARPVNDNYVIGALIAQATTPAFLNAALAEFGTRDGPDAFVIDLGSTFVEFDPTRHMPERGHRNRLKPFSVDEIALMGIIQAVGGDPCSLIPEAGLDLIMPVSPTPGLEDTRSSKGGGALQMHIDNMPFARSYRPEYFGLMGLVSTERVMTSFALVDEILTSLQKLSPRYERSLRRPHYRFRTPMSFHFDGSSQVLSDPVPVIEDGPDGRPVINFNEYSLVRDHEDPAITAALDALAHVLSDESVVREEWISPGKVLLISNERALHARGEVRGTRYLARLYGKRDLSVLRSLASGGDKVYRFRFMMTPAEMVAACRKPVLAGV